MKRNMTVLGAALAGALLALSAGAQDRNRSGTSDSGDRGVVTPQSVENVTTYPTTIPGGQSTIPTARDPMNPNESRPFVQTPEGVRPMVRGDNPNLPNPVTPSAANESAPQRLADPTNSSGMERRAVTVERPEVSMERPARPAAVGATAGDANRSGMYESGDRGVITPGSGGDDAAKRVPRAGSGVSTLPSLNNPASVNESAPDRTGKAVSSGPVRDDLNMPNPKTPANVSESAPDKAGKEQGGVGRTR